MKRLILIGLAALTVSAIAGFSVVADEQSPLTRRKHPVVRITPDRFFTNRSAAELSLPQERDAFTFIVFGDRTGGPREGIAVLEQAVRDANLIEPDLVMTVGDLVEGYNTREPWLEQMREYKSAMDKLLCPWFPVAGNHDVYWRGPDRPPGGHEADFETHFGPIWYSFKHKDCWFIVLYSDEDSPATGQKGVDESHQTMSPRQLQWLKAALEKARDAKHIFVFLHHPRWVGGAAYGKSWEPVHKLLAEAGNVRIVFAGHIHSMRYDGPRDGIEYVTLATVGGAQTHAAPRAGFLHHFNTVTVRDDQIALSAIPVGQILDPRQITGDVSRETQQLAGLAPAIEGRLPVAADGSARQMLSAKLHNPVSRPIEFTAWLESEDRRWFASPDHVHGRIEPGASADLGFYIRRLSNSVDEALRPLKLVTKLEYLADDARFEIPASQLDVPLSPQLAAPERPSGEQAMNFQRGESAVVTGRLIDPADGPFTVECWFKANRIVGRLALISKQQFDYYPNYALFIDNSQPDFALVLHETPQFIEVKPERSALQVGRWHHMAGVYDGAEARLYLDGELVARRPTAAKRSANDAPLLIGAHPDRGAAKFPFDGMIDAVHLSSVARYGEEPFQPVRRPAADDHTVLLLNMDGLIGPWLFDESKTASHPWADKDAVLKSAE